MKIGMFVLGAFALGFGLAWAIGGFFTEAAL
jgi:hypothetical protein